MNTDHIDRVHAGDLLSAERDAQILELLGRQDTASRMIADGLGWQHVDGRRRRKICRFEMTAELTLPQSGAGYADAWKLIWQTGDAVDNLTGTDEVIQVVDHMRMHSKMATCAPDVGAYGLAWVPDDPPIESPYEARWEILTMQTPGPFFGIAQAGMDASESSVQVEAFDILGADGHITLSGYDPFGAGWVAAYGGKYITVYNPPRAIAGTPYWFEVDQYECVFCQWHMRENRYYIVDNLVRPCEVTDSITTVRPCYHISFESTEFVVTEPLPGRANVALKP